MGFVRASGREGPTLGGKISPSLIGENARGGNRREPKKKRKKLEVPERRRGLLPLGAVSANKKGVDTDKGQSQTVRKGGRRRGGVYDA